MSDNLFGDLSLLRRRGSNVIIGKTVRIRYPELVELGDNVIIDDFTYVSTALRIDSDVHISAGCTLIGGRDSLIEFGSFSTLAPHVVLAAGSDDYVGGIATPMVPRKFKGDVRIGSIRIGRHCIIGSHSTVLPDVVLDDGASVGAHSLVSRSLEAWTLYAGVPARPLRQRNRERILGFESELRDERAGKMT
jgi:acetyltransferase-like isoleucine patch superfamily enzyme